MSDRTRLVVRDNPRMGFVATGQFLSGMWHTWGRRATCQECGELIQRGEVARWTLRGSQATDSGTEIVHSRCNPYTGKIPPSVEVVGGAEKTA